VTGNDKSRVKTPRLKRTEKRKIKEKEGILPALKGGVSPFNSRVAEFVLLVPRSIYEKHPA